MSTKQFNATSQGQATLFYNIAHKLARADETFLHLVDSGMTRSDLQRSIDKRPALWGRYQSWLNKLPTERPERHRVA